MSSICSAQCLHSINMLPASELAARAVLESFSQILLSLCGTTTTINNKGQQKGLFPLLSCLCHCQLCMVPAFMTKHTWATTKWMSLAFVCQDLVPEDDDVEMMQELVEALQLESARGSNAFSKPPVCRPRSGNCLQQSRQLVCPPV